MPTTLSTTVRHIYDRVPNSVNSQLIAEFYQFMKDNSTSQRHQNNNLKAIIAYAGFLGEDKTLVSSNSNLFLVTPSCCRPSIARSKIHLIILVVHRRDSISSLRSIM